MYEMCIPCCETTVIKSVVLQNQASVEPFSSDFNARFLRRFKPFLTQHQVNWMAGSSPTILRGSFSIRHLDAFPMVSKVQVTAISRSIGGSRSYLASPLLGKNKPHVLHTPEFWHSKWPDFFCKF